MLGMSMTELVIVLALALLLLGPDQLPSLAKSIGKGMRELRKATDDLKSTFEQEMASVDLDAPRIAAPATQVQKKPAQQDPGEARAAARMAAAGVTPEVPAESGPVPLKLAAPGGTVARGAGSGESQS